MGPLRLSAIGMEWQARSGLAGTVDVGNGTAGSDRIGSVRSGAAGNGRRGKYWRSVDGPGLGWQVLRGVDRRGKDQARLGRRR